MYEAEKEELVKILLEKKINNSRVLGAIGKINRHLFVPDGVKLHAYKDVALPIGLDQTISQPYTVAFMTQLLDVNVGDKILEIGTGSGYQAAILLEMGCKVFSIERNSEIYNRTLKLFDDLSLRAALRCSDGTIGWSEYAPYDGIIVTAGGPSVPPDLKKQLIIGGRLVIPIGDRNSQKILQIKKISDNEFETKSYPSFAFVPLIGRSGWEK